MNETKPTSLTAINVPCNATNYTVVSPRYTMNGTVDCAAMFQDFLIDNMLVFETYHLVRITVTWLIFLVSFGGNTLVLLSSTLWRKNKEISHTQLWITHLSLANLAFTIFILPMDAIWITTMQWLAGDILCRVLNMFKQISLYVSSAVISVVGVDRVLNLLCPVSSSKQKARITNMLLGAWIFSFINSIPACIMFSANPHWPHECECKDYYIIQCVDFKVITDNSVLQRFYLYTMFISFFIPLIIIVVCYVIMAVVIAKMADRAKATEQQSVGFRPPSKRKSLARRSIARAKRVSQIVTILISAVFLVCWGPYYIVGLKQWFVPNQLGKMVELVMLMSSYLNPCLHPLITVILMKDIRQCLVTKLPCGIFATLRSATLIVARKKRYKRKQKQECKRKAPPIVMKAECYGRCA